MTTVASWGWGLNSTWMIVKAIAQGRPPDVILSLDTGAEHEDTYCMEQWYLKNVWEPAGIEYVRLSPQTHTEHYDKRIEGRSLLKFCQDRSIVPLAAARWCSADWKARPSDSWMEDKDVTENWLGFTAEETKRVMRRGCQMPDVAGVNLALPNMGALEVRKKRKRKRENKGHIVRAPLWEDGDTRRDCELGLAAAGLPSPDKSGCGICPYNASRVLRNARAGDDMALQWLDTIITLEKAASAMSDRPVGILPSGQRITDMWELQLPLVGLDADLVELYRPCECLI